MVQRVVRQIRASALGENITVATNEVQQDIIFNQLGENVNVVKEPERRDTFPAIALACSYLSLSEKCDDEEVVIVMPCDTFTEMAYFSAIARMAATVEERAADLVLMGVRPTSPSTKYGYIVPQAMGYGAHVQGVKCFVEKPDVVLAEELLKQWAYWNGGVFAFRLGYMRKWVERYVKASTFEEVLQHYGAFPKISFDYEVVEKATAVAVVPFSGKWRDLGTWNTLAEELPCRTIGNVVLGEENEGTYVINELDQPIFCDGLKDLVVAGSPDGIIVCSKKCSENIKVYIDRLSKRPMYEERRWGTYQVLKSETYEDGTKYLTKSLKIHAGKFISYQVHRKRKEVWTITEGAGIVVVDGRSREVSRGDVIVIEQNQKHSIKAISELEIIEVQLGTELVESDIQRFEWHW